MLNMIPPATLFLRILYEELDDMMIRTTLNP